MPDAGRLPIALWVCCVRAWVLAVRDRCELVYEHNHSQMLSGSPLNEPFQVEDLRLGHRIVGAHGQANG